VRLFHGTDVTRVKTILLNDIERMGLDKIPHLGHRHGGDAKLRAKKENDDIIQLTTILDEWRLLSKLPLYVTDNTDTIATLRLEDGELKYFMLKLEKMDASINCLQQTVNKLLHIISTEIMNEAAGTPLGGTLSTGERSHVISLANRLNELATTHEYEPARELNDTQLPGASSKVGQSSHVDWAHCFSTSSVQSGYDDTEDDGEGKFTLVQRSRRRVHKWPRVSPSQQQNLQDAEAAAPTDQLKSFADAVSSNRNSVVQNQSNYLPHAET